MIYAARQIIQYLSKFVICAVDVTTLGGWALIAEATDDIGNGFANELAQRGINIVLVGGDEIKLKKLAAELNIKYDVHLRSPSLLSAA